MVAMSFDLKNPIRIRFSFLTWCLAAVFCCLIFKMRMAHLEHRPMHGDEANQAVRAGLLLEQGVYHYDPADHHGPVLYYAAMPFCRVSTRTFSETNEINFRMVPVCFSIVTLVLMLGLYRKDGNGLFHRPLGVLIALALVAVSPAMNYYSRFFIQETMFVTFLTGTLVCAVRYVGNESSRAKMLSAAGLGCFLGLALATKETVVLSIVAAGIAGVSTCGFRRLRDAWSTRDAFIVVAGAGGVALLFYSSFFTYPQGVFDAVFATVGTYFKRATAVPEHHHAWNYYLNFLFGWRYGRGPVWSEIGALLLIPVGFTLALPALHWALSKARAKQEEVRFTIRMKWSIFIAIYTIVLTLLYSLIPYKTPWCILSFLHGFLLLAAIGFDTMYEELRNWKARYWGVPVFGILVVCVWVGFALNVRLKQSVQACFKLAADIRNPYVYAHTGMDALKLVEAVEQAAMTKKGQGMYQTLIAIAAPASDYWPLPWYLRKYENVGYWSKISDIPAAFKPDVLIVSADQGDQAESCIGKDFQSNFFGIRPGTLLILFIPQ